MEQSRWRSPVLWTTIVSLVLGLLMQLGVIGDAENKQVMMIVGTILELLSVVGILNNPTDKKNF